VTLPKGSISLGYAEGEASIIINRLQATAYSLRVAALHFSFQPRLKQSVDMTSDVKSRQQLFLGLQDVFVYGHRKSRSQ
jgi:hypothetical protein